MKLNESGFRPLCAHWARLNWARITSWGWEDKWDDTALQTQDSKFKPWGLWGRVRYLSVTEIPHNTFFQVDGEETFFVSFKSPWPGNEPRTLARKAAVLTTTPGLQLFSDIHSLCNISASTLKKRAGGIHCSKWFDIRTGHLRAGPKLKTGLFNLKYNASKVNWCLTGVSFCPTSELNESIMTASGALHKMPAAVRYTFCPRVHYFLPVKHFNLIPPFPCEGQQQ